MSPLDVAGITMPWRVLRAALRPSPEALTLEQLRSDLSHETAAKLARLAGLIQEWQRGSFRAGDVADAGAILLDLERIHLRHARLAAATFGTFARLARLLGAIGRARSRLRALRGPGAPQSRDIQRFADLVARVRQGSPALCEALSARHGARFAGLVGEAVEELRGEAGGVAVALEGAAEAPRAWVPREDAAAWADILRNLIRNAVQATKEARAAAPRRVTVRILPMRERAGTTLEVLDEGVGMNAEAVAAMWQAGRSRHGGQHGQGLTESKRAFVESRAALEVRSAEGVGTCVRVDLPHRDVPVRAPRPWALPPLMASLLVVLAAAALGVPAFLQPEIVDVEMIPDTFVSALDARGSEVWRRDLGEEVLPNFLGNGYTRTYEQVEINHYLVLPRRWPWSSNVIVATKASQGPGHLWRLGFGGRTVWKRTLAWEPPREAHTGSLKSMFQVAIPWDPSGREAIAMNVRDADWGSTAIQFITPGGVGLGAYHHPGHLEYRKTTDLDGDGRVELILTGRNNRAPSDSTVYRESPGEEWIECLVMLEPPRVDGQAYPYNGWEGMPPANEEVYLLIPPMRRGPKRGVERPAIEFVDFGSTAAPGGTRVEVRMADGRIYTLDSRLRPLACGVGSETWAATLAPTRALAPLLYFHHGRRETIDLPILRGP